VLRSQEGCLYGGERLVSVSLSKRAGRYARGKDSQASDVPAEIARPSAELCWTAPCRERPGRKRRWRNQRISLTPGDERESRGEALTAVYLSHRVSAGPDAAPNLVPHRRTRGRIHSCVDIHHHQARRRRERCACPSGLGSQAPHLPRQRRRPCGTASPSAKAVATGRSTPAMVTTVACSSLRPGPPGNQGGTDRDRTSGASWPRCECLADLRPTCGTDQVERQGRKKRDAGDQS
jgi:hypothetical protein